MLTSQNTILMLLGTWHLNIDAIYYLREILNQNRHNDSVCNAMFIGCFIYCMPYTFAVCLDAVVLCK